jgi:tetratricopeptide (TPR) repeat protein
MMATSKPNLNREFGTLLTQGLRSIAAREDKDISALEHELAIEMDRTFATIEKWRQGRTPPVPKQVELLARACVRRGNMEKQWLVRFLHQARYPEKDTLIQELFPPGEEPKEPSGPLIRHNLPRRSYERFVGREKELVELGKYLSRECRHGVVCLIGMAGVGKTTLALEIAHRFLKSFHSLTSNERFAAIVWVTAKQAEFFYSGLFIRQPTFTDLSTLYRALAEVLDLPAITRAVADEDRYVIVARALAEHRILIVLDNLEDVDDPALMVFLRDLPEPSKAIVTSRHRIGIGVSIDLRAFKESEARELIHFECQRHNLSLTNEQAERLLRHTGGLALAIVRTIGRMAWRGSKIEAELRQLGNPANSIYDFCFKQSIALIQSKVAHRLFMALALFSSDATRDALGYVAGFDGDVLDRDEGLSDLEVLSLVNKESNRYSLESLTKVKARAELAAHQEFEREARERWIEWYKKLAEQVEVAVDYSNIQMETNNMISVIGWLIDQGRMADVNWFFQRIRHFLYAIGSWRLLVRLSEQVATWAETIDDPEMLAIALDSLTNVFRRKEDRTRGEEWLERIQISATRLKNELLQAQVWLNQVAILYHLPTASQKEIDIVTQALEVFRRYSKTVKVAEALNTLGNLHLKQRRFEEATHYYQEGLRVLDEEQCKAPEAFHWRAAIRGNLGLVAGRQGRYQEACDILNEVLKEFTEKTDIAEAHAALALYEHYLNHTEQAHSHRQQADRIVKQLNLTLPLCPEDTEWNRLRLG